MRRGKWIVLLGCCLAFGALATAMPANAQQTQPVGGQAAPPDPRPFLPAGDFLDQPVLLSGCYYSDTDSPPQIIADDFVVPAGLPIQIDEVVAWVIYHPQGAPPAVHSPKIRFWTESGGLPDAMISEEDAVPTVAVDTGLTDGDWGLDVYMLTMSLNQPVVLPAGAGYFVEITDNTGDFSNRFCWEHGQLDAARGVEGYAVATEEPPQEWIRGSLTDMAVELNGAPIPVELESFEIEK